MPGNSAPKSTTTTTKNEPMSELKPLVLDMNKEAERLRKQGTEHYYPGSTVVDWSQQTKDAYRNQETMANDPGAQSILGNAHGTTNAIINGQTFSARPGQTFTEIQNSAGNPYLNVFSNIASGAQVGQSPVTGRLDDMAAWKNPGVAATAAAATTLDNSATGAMRDQAGYTNEGIGGLKGLADRLNGSTNSAIGYLTDTASGKYLNGDNPALQGFLKESMEPFMADYTNATKKNLSSFASGGRLGSNAHAYAQNTTDENASKGMATAAANIAFQNYNAERDRMEAAKTAIGNFNNTDVANSQAAWNSLAGTSSDQQGLRQNAINSWGSLQNAFSGLALGAANQVGNQAVAEQGVKKGALDTLTNQYQADRANQLRAAESGASTHAADQDRKLNAAQSQGSLEVAQTAQRAAAAQSAGSIYDNLFKPIDQLKQVGSAYEQQTGAYLQDDINRTMAEKNSGWNDLQNQNAILNGGGYGVQTATAPLYSNTGAQAAGGVLGALGGLGKALK